MTFGYKRIAKGDYYFSQGEFIYKINHGGEKIGHI